MSLKVFNRSGATATDTVFLSSADGTLVVPEARLLFGAQFLREGRDLILRNDGHADLRILDYFRANPPADLFAPDGAVLRGATVARLAGPEAPGQYAQIGGARGGEPIGQVETTEGGTRVQRTDGTVETLAVGMKIFQGDVVETDGDGALSLTFADGTIFTLASASRMVIDELVYDPDGTDNSAGFSLVQGGFVFIAGQVAQTGGMDVTTPSATMGIRGTTVIVRIQLDNGIAVTEVTLTRDPDGSLGQVELRDLDGNLIATITSTESKWIVSSAEGQTREVERTAADDAADSLLIADAVAAFQIAATRVAQGETFVTLPSAPPLADTGPTGAEEESEGSDIDTEDEPLPPPAPVEEGEGGSDGGGGTGAGPAETPPVRPPVEAVDLVVTGPEDAGMGEEGEPVAGTIDTGETGTTFALETPPANGTVTVNPDGTFEYVPDPDFNGTDSFTYRVTDSRGNTDTGTVEVVITPVNDDPVPTDSGGAGNEDTTLFGTIAATDVDGDPLGYALETGASNGLAAVQSNGTWSYIPNPNFNGTDTFTVRVTDDQGGSAIATVSVEVAAVNDTPVITSSPQDAAGAVTEDDAVTTATGTLAAADVDQGDSVTWTGNAPGTYGSFAIDAAGSWTYTLDNTLAKGLSAGQVETETFTATATDTNGATVTQEVTITITGANDAPVITSGPQDATGAVTEDAVGTTATGQLTTTDPDAGDSVTWTGSAPGAYGGFAIAEDGSWTYTLDNTLANGLSAGEVETETFTATATDTNGATVTQDVIITITGANDAPLIVSADAAGFLSEAPDGSGEGELFAGGGEGDFIFEGDGEGESDPIVPFGITGEIAVSDVDDGSTHTAAFTPGGPGYVGTFTIDETGFTSAGPDGGSAGILTWDFIVDPAEIDFLPEGEDLVQTYTITITDDAGGSVDQVVTITITGANDAAFIAGTTAGEVAEDATAPVTGQVTVFDPDTGEAAIEPQTDVAGLYGTFSIDAAGNWTYSLDNSNPDVQALPQGAEIYDWFGITSADGTGWEEITITIVGVNDGAAITGGLTGDVIEDDLLSTSGFVTVTDPDTGEDGVQPQTDVAGQYGTFSIDAAGNWSFVLDSANPDVDALPAGETLEDRFSVTSTDGTATDDVVVTITGTNDAAMLEGGLSGGIAEDTVAAVTGKIDVTDPDTGEAEVVPQTGTSGSFGTFDIDAAGNWSYVLDNTLDAVQALAPGDTLEDRFPIVSADGAAFDDVVVTITGVNDAAVLTDGLTGQIEEDTFGFVSGVVTVDDPDTGENGLIADSGTTTYGSFEVSENGAWTYTLDDANPAVNALPAGEELEDRFSVTSADGTATEDVVISIIGRNDAAVLGGDLTGSIEEDAQEPATGTVTVDDPDTGEAQVLEVVEQAGTYGTFSILPDGSWTYILDSEQTAIQSLGTGDSATDQFVVTPVDLSSNQLVVITITGVNDAPEVTGDPAESAGAVTEGSENATASGQLTAEDVDGDEVTFTLTSPATGTYGSLVLLASGAWTYTLDQAAADPLGVGEQVTDVFSVEVRDPEGAFTTQDITITITGTNDAPVVPFNTLIEVQQDSVFSDTLAAFDVEGDDLTFSAGSTAPLNGSLTINPDNGTFEYQPNAGFLGTDTFTYEVSDGNGGTSTGTVNVEVENSETTGDTRPIAIGISTEATPEVPAGSLVIEVDPVAGNAINISFALDSSGSIGASQWTVMVNAVANALETLATQFAGSETQVDVQIISYSNTVTVFTSDLQNTNLGTQVRGLPFQNDATNWTAAFQSAETFFDAQPAGETNYFFFITDGDPTVAAAEWQAALASLTNVTANGYAVDIDAFAIGTNVNGANLTLVDSDPVPAVGTNYTTLTSAADLLAALSETPIFNPELIGLTVQLIADGVDRGVIADQTNPALAATGLDYQLPFAAIDGIADQLGEENRFNVTVQYDLNGDPSTAEVTLFTTELLAKAATAQTLTGDAGPDLLLGSDFADTIDGAGGADVIFGFDGDDVITGGAGGNDIRAGGGDDRIIVNETNLLGGRVDGGAGQDVVAFGTGGNLTDLLDDLLLLGIETIDLENGLSNSMILSGTKVIEASDTANTLLESLLGSAPLGNSMIILGDTGDALTLFDDAGGEWQGGGAPVSSGGRTLDIYELVDAGTSEILATIGVDNEISVSLSGQA